MFNTVIHKLSCSSMSSISIRYKAISLLEFGNLVPIGLRPSSHAVSFWCLLKHRINDLFVLWRGLIIAERDRLKPAPPPKPAGLSGQQMTLAPQRTYAINVNPDFFSQMRMLQKQAHDLRMEVKFNYLSLFDYLNSREWSLCESVSLSKRLM